MGVGCEFLGGGLGGPWRRALEEAFWEVVGLTRPRETGSFATIQRGNGLFVLGRFNRRFWTITNLFLCIGGGGGVRVLNFSVWMQAP